MKRLFLVLALVAGSLFPSLAFADGGNDVFFLRRARVRPQARVFVQATPQRPRRRSDVFIQIAPRSRHRDEVFILRQGFNRVGGARVFVDVYGRVHVLGR